MGVSDYNPISSYSLFCNIFDYPIDFLISGHIMICWDPMVFDLAVKDVEETDDFGEYILVRSAIGAIGVANRRLVVCVNDDGPCVREL